MDNTKKMQDNSIGKRLLYGFTKILIIFLITSILSLIGIGNIKSKFDEFYNRPYHTSMSSMRIRSALNALERLTIEYVYDIVPQNEIMKEIDVQVKHLDDNVVVLQERFHEDPEKVSQLQQLSPQVGSIRTEILNLKNSGNDEQAEYLLKSEFKAKMKEARDIADQIYTVTQESAANFYKEGTLLIVLVNVVMIGAIVVGVVAAILISKKIIKSIEGPIKEVEKAASDLSKGILDIQIAYQGNDEIGELANSMRGTVDTLNLYINDISSSLTAMAEGNMTREIEIEYIGSFLPIKQALNEISDKLNHTLKQINQSAEQVTSGAESIAQGATELAQGATQQASIIQEFMASTEEIAQSINETVEKVDQTSKISQEAQERASEGIQVMDKMLVSMNDISESSVNISEVLKTIDNIASQTNLLALNAAIESARAGEAGKGFAVVANEIRDLANRSSDTVKEIENIIQTSLQNVETGQVMANQAAQALKEIVSSVESTAAIAGELRGNINQQKESIGELAQGTKQIASVVEANSSTSQENAAISEELAAQAEILKRLIQYFNLKK